jgi:hypothetical protein
MWRWTASYNSCRNFQGEIKYLIVQILLPHVHMKINILQELSNCWKSWLTNYCQLVHKITQPPSSGITSSHEPQIGCPASLEMLKKHWKPGRLTRKRTFDMKGAPTVVESVFCQGPTKVVPFLWTDMARNHSSHLTTKF